jgi:Ca-activated chloride channel homolog
MSFSSPLWLALLGLIPVIVIIHSISARWRSTPVSSLVFWNEVLRERRTSIRVRRLLRNLTLLLQLFCTALLAVALAGPRLAGRSFASAGDTVLVLDTTASMQTREGPRTRFDLARARALEVLGGMRRGARMAVVSAGPASRVLVPFTADRDALRRALQRARAADEPGDIGQDMLFALSLRDARRGDQVVLITDGAFDTLGAADTSAPWMRVLRVGSRRDNTGITGLSFRRTLGAEDSYELFVSLRHVGGQPVTVPLTISAGATAVVSQAVTVPADGERTLSMAWNGPTTGRIEAGIRTGDDFPLDDRAYAVFAPARTVRVLLVGPGTYFLQKALGSLPGVVLRTEPPADVVVYDGIQPPPVDPGNYIFFASVPPNLPVRATGVIPAPRVTGWSRTDPLLSSVELGGLSIGQALLLEPGPGFQPLAAFRDSPLMFSWDHNGRKALFVAFDPARSDLPLRPGFPILLANALAWFYPDWLTVQADQVPAGAPRAIPASRSTPVIVVKPDGSREVAAEPGSEAEFFDTDRVGWYRVEADGRAAEFAVSLVSASESDITPRAAGAGTADAGSAPQSSASGAETSAWVLFALAAMAMILLEWLVWLRARDGARG